MVQRGAQDERILNIVGDAGDCIIRPRWGRGWGSWDLFSPGCAVAYPGLLLFQPFGLVEFFEFNYGRDATPSPLRGTPPWQGESF